jgi:fused signal recognition particle receptor
LRVLHLPFLSAEQIQNRLIADRRLTAALTGLFLAKLDGTAKGGIVVAIRETLAIPVKFIGVGETPDDVEPFDPGKFVEAMFAE